MGLNFPSSPAANTIYPRVPPTPGVAYRYVPTQWRDMAGTAETKNRFQNPAFQVSEYNYPDADGTVDGLVLAEGQWSMYAYSNNGVFRGQRVSAVTPRGSLKRVRITVQTADTALADGEWLNFFTAMEGLDMADLKWGTPDAVQCVVRFGWKSPAGTYILNIRNPDLTHSYLASWTVSAALANTDTEVLLIIPGPTVGVWPNNNTAWAWIYFMIANAYQWDGNADEWIADNWAGWIGASNNGMQQVGNVYELFDVGWYADPNKTGIPPEWEQPDEHQERIRGRRYFQRVFGLRGIVAPATNVTRAMTTLQTPMRVVPTLARGGTPKVYDAGAAPSVTSLGTNYSQQSSVVCVDLVTTAGGMTVGRRACHYWTSYADCIYAKAWL